MDFTLKINTVSIVGCGWFGLPLAKHLIEQGFKVCGSKRDAEAATQLANDGIKAFSLDLDNQKFNGETLDLVLAAKSDSEVRASFVSRLYTDALVINIPPSLKKQPGAYLERLGLLNRLISQHTYKRIIFISTTGVYPSTGEAMTESDAVAYSPASQTLLQAEALFLQLESTCVLRFSGLIGPARHPGRFLAGKTGLEGADAPVNLVHLDDCIAAVSCLLQSDEVSSIYNLTAPEHPSRREFYTQAAEYLSLEVPQFGEKPQVAKIIDGSKITRELGFNYQHNSPLGMLSQC